LELLLGRPEGFPRARRRGVETGFEATGPGFGGRQAVAGLLKHALALGELGLQLSGAGGSFGPPSVTLGLERCNMRSQRLQLLLVRREAGLPSCQLLLELGQLLLQVRSRRLAFGDAPFRVGGVLLDLRDPRLSLARLGLCGGDSILGVLEACVRILAPRLEFVPGGVEERHDLVQLLFLLLEGFVAAGRRRPERFGFRGTG
jgi:hypothetical protein